MEVFMQGLNVTIYGLGIVFLALLILMVVIMILGKVFSVATGREMFSTAVAEEPETERQSPLVAVAGQRPAEAAPSAGSAVFTGVESIEPVTSPLPGKILSIAVKPGDAVRKGDELCVVEAMKMGNSIKAARDGVVREVLVASGDSVAFGATLVTIAVPQAAGVAARAPSTPAASFAPATPAAVPAGAQLPDLGRSQASAEVGSCEGSVMRLGVAGRQYTAELSLSPAGGWTVTLDGVAFQVTRDQSEPKKVIVNGKAHSVEVRDVTATMASVVIDGEPQKVELTRESLPSSAEYAMDAEGRQHKVEITRSPDGSSTLVIDGESFLAASDRSDQKKIVVNGKPHTVEIRELAGTVATVLIDGVPQKVSLVRQVSEPPRAATLAPTPIIAPPPTIAPRPTPAAQPAPVPAPAAAPIASTAPPTRAAGPGERVTAPLPGKVLSVAVKAGDIVRKGSELCVIEAMKMGNSIKSQRDGTVRQVLVSAGDPIGYGAPLVILDLG